MDVSQSAFQRHSLSLGAAAARAFAPLPAWPVFLLVAVCLFGGTAQSAFAAISLEHKQAPAFVLTGLDNGRIDLQAYQGKVVLLNFWATWCAPCQIEMPRFVAWQKAYGPLGLQIVGISMDDDPGLARKAYRRLNLNYPVAMGDETLGELYGGVLGLPMTFLIDAHGTIQAQYQGAESLDKIESRLKSLLTSR